MNGTGQGREGKRFGFRVFDIENNGSLRSANHWRVGK